MSGRKLGAWLRCRLRYVACLLSLAEQKVDWVAGWLASQSLVDQINH